MTGWTSNERSLQRGEDKEFQEKEEGQKNNAADGSSHDVGRDPCGAGDDRKDLEWYVPDPGRAAADGGGNGHGGGMGNVLSIWMLGMKKK